MSGQTGVHLFKTYAIDASPCPEYGAEWGVDSFNLAIDDVNLSPVNGTDSCN
jgi:hypothetical protein